MDMDISNSWALYQIKGWKEANNALDTLLCYEYAQTSQRHYSQYESQIQLTWAIRDNMLDRMKGFMAFGARKAEPEHRLTHNIRHTLKLPTGSITPLYRDRTA